MQAQCACFKYNGANTLSHIGRKNSSKFRKYKIRTALCVQYKTYKKFWSPIGKITCSSTTNAYTKTNRNGCGCGGLCFCFLVNFNICIIRFRQWVGVCICWLFVDKKTYVEYALQLGNRQLARYHFSRFPSCYYAFEHIRDICEWHGAQRLSLSPSPVELSGTIRIWNRFSFLKATSAAWRKCQQAFRPALPISRARCAKWL